MRNYIKNDLLELVQTMKELCSEILRACERNTTDYLIELLEQGQQAAISMGETIEKFEGDGTEAVSALEVFCDHMYELSETAASGETAVSKERKTFDRLLLNIENGIRHLPVTYEIVFFPYKASMWDCMESIYLVAVKDSDCRAYVVPIPYYDMERGGRFGQMHYEGDQFPTEIPIISWERYKLSERRPDIAYIHNPFDGYNLVTSIHPEYYSDRLKASVGKLVYVPYGIWGAEIPESHQKLPVYKNMDYMVIQTRKQAKFFQGPEFEGKLLPLGSPKFDRVVNYQKSGVEMPEEWKGVLDGKVKFFYNTSLSVLLKDTEATLKKIEYVISCFEGREDAALIWRPHPLMDSTLQSMRPQYLEWYRQIVQRFRQQGTGVFDTTSDVSRTIALSDAYIGEEASSVVDLFCATGKPLFILDMNVNTILSEREYCDPLFCGVVECGGKYWTFSYQFNALCTLDMETGKVDIVNSIPRAKLKQDYLVSSVYNYNGKLIIAPDHMDAIAEYDIETGKFDFIKLPDALSWANMGGVIPLEDGFLMLPARYHAVIQYSSKKKKYVYHWQIVDDVLKLRKKKGNEDSSYPIAGGILKNRCWYLILPRTNGILIWNIDTFQYEIVQVGDDENEYSAIADVRDGFLLQMREGARLLFWNPQTGETNVIDQFPIKFERCLDPNGEDHPFGGFLMAKDHLLLMPQLEDQILEINRDTLEISIYKIDWKEHIQEPREGIFDNRWGNIRNYIITSVEDYINQDYNEIGIITSADGCLLKLDIEKHQYTEVQLHYDYEALRNLFAIEHLYDKFELPIKSRENRYYTLGNFMDAMVDGRISKMNSQQIQAYREISANLDGTCGEKVHKAVKKTIQ